MATSNAARQAAYRARHLRAVDGSGERLNGIITLSAKRSLERLASCYGVTQRAVLEKLLREAENQAITAAGAFPNGQSDYYDKKLRLPTVTA